LPASACSSVYGRTCERWVENFEYNRTAAVRITGEKRYRIWSIYRAGCAFGFAQNWINMYQVLAIKARRARLFLSWRTLWNSLNGSWLGPTAWVVAFRNSTLRIDD
jgi:hypothetical protein